MLKLIEHHTHNLELLAFTGRVRKSLQMNGRNKSAGILLVFKGICQLESKSKSTLRG